MLSLSSCTSKENKVVEDTPNNTTVEKVEEKEKIEVIKDEEVVKTEIKEFKMDSYTEIIDWKYAPKFSVKNIEVNEGDTVRLKINTTKWKHDITIDELNVFSETPEGEVTIVEFVADKKGSFVYYCSKPNHRQNGHWGTIVVK